jgi:SAM-dependent methyltransferase
LITTRTGGLGAQEKMGLSLALKRVVRVVLHFFSDGLLDIGYCGTFLGGSTRPTSKAPGAYPTESTYYSVLAHIFRTVPLLASDVLVDVGCGKGRVLLWAARHGYHNRMVGIEVNERIAAGTRKRLSKFPNIEIRTLDIRQYLPKEGTYFYLYNPFEREVLVAFKKRLMQVRDGRPTTVVYFNPLFAEVFSTDSYWDVTIQRLPLPLMEDMRLAVIRSRI